MVGVEPLPVMAWLLPWAFVTGKATRTHRPAWVFVGLHALALLIYVAAALRSEPYTDVRMGEAGTELIARLGVSTEVTEHGLTTTHITPSSAAANAGIPVGAILYELDGAPLGSADDLRREVRQYPPDTEVRLRLLDPDDGEQTLTVRLGSVRIRTEAAIARIRYVVLASYAGGGLLLLLMVVLAWRAGPPERGLVPAALIPVALLAHGPAAAYVWLALPVLAWLLWWNHRQGRPLVALPGLGVLRCTALAIVATPLLMFMAMWVSLLLKHASGIPWQAASTSVVTRSLEQVPLVAIVLLGPVLEELSFRGIVLPSLRRSIGPWPAIALTSVAFGLLHPVPEFQPIVVAPLGAVFGYVRLRTGRVWPCVLLHVLVNTVSMAFLGRFG